MAPMKVGKMTGANQGAIKVAKMTCKKKTISKMALRTFKRGEALSKLAPKSIDAAAEPKALPKRKVKGVEEAAGKLKVAKTTSKKVSLGKMALQTLKTRKPMSKRKAKDVDEPVDDEPSAELKLARQPVGKARAMEEELIEQTRKKELKSMPVVDLKGILESKGLSTGKKEDMVQSLLKAEAKVRADARAHETKVKLVLDKIRLDLEATSNPEIKELCGAKGMKVSGSKDERINRLLDHSKLEGEVERILRENARNARREELASADKAALLKRCEKAKIDPLVHEVMVERLFSHESATGVTRLLTPEEGKEPSENVENLANKRKALKAKDTHELKQLAQEKGLQASKKDDMVQALLEHAIASEAEAARKKELRALGKDGLKELAASVGAEVSNMGAMIEAVVAKEAKVREEFRKQKAIAAAIEAEKKGDLTSKSSPELKDLCGTSGLKIGGSKDEKVERLLQAARDAGEIERVLLSRARASRREELSTFSKAALKSLCDRAGLDTLIKEVMVERIVSAEFDVDLQPEAKKAHTA